MQSPAGPKGVYCRIGNAGPQSCQEDQPFELSRLCNPYNPQRPQPVASECDSHLGQGRVYWMLHPTSRVCKNIDGSDPSGGEGENGHSVDWRTGLVFATWPMSDGWGVSCLENPCSGTWFFCFLDKQWLLIFDGRGQLRICKGGHSMKIAVDCLPWQIGYSETRITKPRHYSF